MTVKDLPSNVDLFKTKIRIPQKYKEDCFQSGLTTDKIYLHSSWFCGIWVKTDLSSDRVYPLQINPDLILDWEVVEQEI